MSDIDARILGISSSHHVDDDIEQDFKRLSLKAKETLKEVIGSKGNNTTDDKNDEFPSDLGFIDAKMHREVIIYGNKNGLSDEEIAHFEWVIVKMAEAMIVALEMAKEDPSTNTYSLVSLARDYADQLEKIHSAQPDNKNTQCSQLLASIEKQVFDLIES